jgi:transcriptional regulator with XRE-family HTH domain
VNEDIGSRLRELRGRRTQKAVAELAGISKGHLSNLESGRRRLDSRHLINRLSDVLGVAPSDLLDQPWLPSVDAGLTAVHSAVPDIRRRLVDTVIGEPDGPTMPMAELERAAGRVTDAGSAGRYDELARDVPDLMGALLTTIAEGGADRTRSCQLLSLVTMELPPMLRRLGYTDLALIAAERAQDAAAASDDPLWIAASAHPACHALLSANATTRAYAMVSRAADGASRLLGTRDTAPAEAIHGQLLLASAFAAVAVGRAVEAVERLDEAALLAEHTGQQNKDALWFGPTNVAIHRVSIATELGDRDSIVGLGRRVDMAALPARSRAADYWADLARGLAGVRGRDHDAVTALRLAEEASAQRVRSNVFARELVAPLLARTRRSDDRRWLKSFAVRINASV